VKLIVDCALSAHLLALPADSAISTLLRIANVTCLNIPLEALVSEQYGLKAQPDYPIAAIAAHADGLQVGNAYWLRADPVHLLLQRDSFSLTEPVPLPVEHTHAQQIIASLNQHFGVDGMTYCLGNSGAWYVRMDSQPEVQTALPAIALDRNIYQFMPTGVDASKWHSYMNEVQMLLHAHAVNHERESMPQPAINSVWFSGGGVMPHGLSVEMSPNLILANSPFYHGLAKLLGLAVNPVDMNWPNILLQEAGEVRVALSDLPLSDDANFKALWQAVKGKSIQQLILNLGCYEKTLVATVKPMDVYKFWRKNKSVSSYLI
jgi:hypothetical protein